MTNGAVDSLSGEKRLDSLFVWWTIGVHLLPFKPGHARRTESLPCRELNMLKQLGPLGHSISVCRSAVVCSSLLSMLFVASVARADDAAGTKTPPAGAAEEKPAVEPAPVDIEKLNKDFSYAFGINLGGNMKAQDVPLDVESFVEGLKTALAGKESRLSEEDIQKVMVAFQQQMQLRIIAKMKVEAEAAKKVADEHLAKNAKAEGVVTTKSGLQYRVFKKGEANAPMPKATDTVSVHYHGTLVDGTVFDSSIERKMPATFAVNQVIPGWTEALQLMRVGDKFELTIPPDLAYGERGAGEDIGPNEVLIFEVELLSIKAAPAATPAPKE
ncbi:MAG: FKBP-type peptidyl-prolyl cis-trans isomerase [Planctomycetaceae bacterium]